MLNFIPIDADGSSPDAEEFIASPNVGAMVALVNEATAGVYRATGFAPPWIGYYAEREGELVGTCAFKSPPQVGRVEIAYFTFPDYERQGVATAMAQQLVALAWERDPNVLVFAQTLPEHNASTRLLGRLGFQFAGSVEHPEDGLVWEWRLTPATQSDGDASRKQDDAREKNVSRE